MKKWYEAYEKNGYWQWKIYHYDETGNKEIIDYASKRGFIDRDKAEDNVCLFMEENNIEAELG
jgi:hypothetical protein